MQRARLGFVHTVVALTGNRTLNSVFVARARDRFGVTRGLVATSEPGVGLVSEQVGSGEASLAFDGPHDVERWDVRGRRGDVEVAHFVCRGSTTREPVEASASGGLSERYVAFAVERDDVRRVMHAGWLLREGDVLAVAIHAPEREDALRELAELGLEPAPGASQGVATDEGASGAGADD